MLKKLLKKRMVKIGLILSTITIVLLSTGVFAKKNPFPQMDLNTVKAEDIIKIEGETKNKYYDDLPKKLKTTYATLAVPENRNKANSRLISIPIKILHSLNENPKEPVFRLTGGPGASNIKRTADAWLLENHDIVMVGYRGIDGSVFMESAEIAEALVVKGDPFAIDNIKKLAKVSSDEFNRLKNEGIDVDAYNVIEVIHDLEDARKALGYDKINLIGYSYGTRLAYLYGLKYPESVNRTVIEGVNPPGHFVWRSKDNEDILRKVAAEWQMDSLCVQKSPDILATMQKVYQTLPYTWRRIEINKPKLNLMMFMMAYQANGFAQIFDAFIAAENGDYSGLAFLVMAYDQLPNMKGMAWGENFSKALSADFDPHHDYLSDDPDEALMGAVFSKIFAINTYGGWPIKLIPEKYRKLQHSNVETLLLSGDIDVSTPCHNATRMLEYLPNGHQVIFENRGHQDPGTIQAKEYRKLIMNYYLTGNVDSSEIKKVPINFHDPKPSFQKMGKIFRFIKRLGLTKFVTKLMN